MNAQEAMNYIDREIRHLSVGIEYKVPSEREMIEDNIEALSIVLESARLLHEVLEAPTTEVIEEGIIKCFVNGSITIDKKTQKDIGIAEGAEE